MLIARRFFSGVLGYDLSRTERIQTRAVPFRQRDAISRREKLYGVDVFLCRIVTTVGAGAGRPDRRILTTVGASAGHRVAVTEQLRSRLYKSLFTAER